EEIIEYARNSRKEIHHDDEVNIHDLIQKIIDNFDFTENRDKIKICNDTPRDHVISTDKGRLKIVLNNLIGNAIKYHDVNQDEPFVQITSIISDNEIQLKVHDNGLGIEKELQEKVFEMFYRASATSDGSGLGLYIAREMVDNLNGRLELESEPGKGSLFTIIMPLVGKVVK
ncbi:MAG: HAMP domain-containing sensor histidine kinase, partial [Cyclobacteriaceae bacterium]